MQSVLRRTDFRDQQQILPLKTKNPPVNQQGYAADLNFAMIINDYIRDQFAVLSLQQCRPDRSVSDSGSDPQEYRTDSAGV